MFHIFPFECIRTDIRPYGSEFYHNAYKFRISSSVLPSINSPSVPVFFSSSALSFSFCCCCCIIQMTFPCPWSYLICETSSLFNLVRKWEYFSMCNAHFNATGIVSVVCVCSFFRCLFHSVSLVLYLFVCVCVCLSQALVTLCFCSFRITSQKIWIWHIRIWALCPRNGTVGFAAAIHHIYGYPLSFAPFQMLSKIYVWRHTRRQKREWKIQSTFVALFCMIYGQKLELRFEMHKKRTSMTWRRRQRLRESERKKMGTTNNNNNISIKKTNLSSAGKIAEIL